MHRAENGKILSLYEAFIAFSPWSQNVLIPQHEYVLIHTEYRKPLKLTQALVYRVFTEASWHRHDWVISCGLSHSQVNWYHVVQSHHHKLPCYYLASQRPSGKQRLSSRSWGQSPDVILGKVKFFTTQIHSLFFEKSLERWQIFEGLFCTFCLFLPFIDKVFILESYF